MTDTNWEVLLRRTSDLIHLAGYNLDALLTEVATMYPHLRDEWARSRPQRAEADELLQTRNAFLYHMRRHPDWDAIFVNMRKVSEDHRTVKEKLLRKGRELLHAARAAQAVTEAQDIALDTPEILALLKHVITTPPLRPLLEITLRMVEHERGPGHREVLMVLTKFAIDVAVFPAPVSLTPYPVTDQMLDFFHWVRFLDEGVTAAFLLSGNADPDPQEGEDGPEPAASTEPPHEVKGFIGTPYTVRVGLSEGVTISGPDGEELLQIPTHGPLDKMSAWVLSDALEKAAAWMPHGPLPVQEILEWVCDYLTETGEWDPPEDPASWRKCFGAGIPLHDPTDLLDDSLRGEEDV